MHEGASRGESLETAACRPPQDEGQAFETPLSYYPADPLRFWLTNRAKPMDQMPHDSDRDDLGAKSFAGASNCPDFSVKTVKLRAVESASLMPR